MRPDASFFAKPEEETCQVGTTGICTVKPYLRIYCTVEGVSLLVCSPCFANWQSKVALKPALTGRCPRCENMFASEPSVHKTVQPAVPLPGPVGEAIDAAMHAEGLLRDVRERVLIRLYRDAAWLAAVRPVATYEGMTANTAGVRID